MGVAPAGLGRGTVLLLVSASQSSGQRIESQCGASSLGAGPLSPEARFLCKIEKVDSTRVSF